MENYSYFLTNFKHRHEMGKQYDRLTTIIKGQVNQNYEGHN
jgi:hypothetical protein